MTEYRIRLSIEEQRRLEAEADRLHQTPREVAAALLSRAAMRLPPPPTGPRHRRSQMEIRAQQRATSPDGMSAFTREIQTIRTTDQKQESPL